MFLSFIIPVYNLGKWLDQCLKSISDQLPATEYEVVIVDDGSTDDSMQYASRWRNCIPHLKIVSQPNSGVNPARENGLKNSSGEYIWFIDGDDQIHPQALACVCSAIRKNPDCELFFCHSVSGEKIVFPAILPEDAVVHTYPFDNLPLLVIHSTIFRRTLIEKQKFDNYAVGEDIIFTQKQIIRCTRVCEIPFPLYGYQIRSSSVMHQRSYTRQIQGLQFDMEMLRFISEEGCIFKKKYSSHFVNIFLFRQPQDILSFRGDERRVLSDMWFDMVSRMPEEVLNPWQSRLRAILRWHHTHTFLRFLPFCFCAAFFRVYCALKRFVR